MDAKEFQIKIQDAQNLMQKERFQEALELLEYLKEVEKLGDFDYSLTHKLYQLISNSKSLYNQQVILNKINQVSHNEQNVSLYDLDLRLRKEENLELEISILKREIELLILRGLINCQIQGDKLILKK